MLGAEVDGLIITASWVHLYYLAVPEQRPPRLAENPTHSRSLSRSLLLSIINIRIHIAGCIILLFNHLYSLLATAYVLFQIDLCTWLLPISSAPFVGAGIQTFYVLLWLSYCLSVFSY